MFYGYLNVTNLQNVMMTYSNYTPIESVTNEELKKVDVWMKSNKLSVNIEKTNYIIFKSNRKTVATNFSLCFGNKLLEQKKTIKYFGSIYR
jgi:hypothetical protein